MFLGSSIRSWGRSARIGVRQWRYDGRRQAGSILDCGGTSGLPPALGGSIMDSSPGLLQFFLPLIALIEITSFACFYTWPEFSKSAKLMNR